MIKVTDCWSQLHFLCFKRLYIFFKAQEKDKKYFKINGYLIDKFTGYFHLSTFLYFLYFQQWACITFRIRKTYFLISTKQDQEAEDYYSITG